MAVMHLARAVLFNPGIQSKDDLGDFAPVGALVISVKYP